MYFISSKSSSSMDLTFIEPTWNAKWKILRETNSNRISSNTKNNFKNDRKRYFQTTLFLKLASPPTAKNQSYQNIISIFMEIFIHILELIITFELFWDNKNNSFQINSFINFKFNDYYQKLVFKEHCSFFEFCLFVFLVFLWNLTVLSFRSMSF